MTTRWGEPTPAELPYLRRLGTLLARLRHAVGLSQRELGNRANLGTKHIARLERGHRRTRAATLARLVSAAVSDTDVAAIWLDALVEAAGPALAPTKAEAARRYRRNRAVREAMEELL